MKVAVLGGTGKMGRALAGKLAKGNKVIIGSRDAARARKTAEGIPGAVGMDYAHAAREADAVIMTIPDSAIGTISALAKDLSGKLVISAVNPLKLQDGILLLARDQGSAAEDLAKMLPKSRVATAFNNIPARFLQKDEVIPIDVLVAADSKDTYDQVATLVRSIPNLRPLYAGPLSQAGLVEMITALVLNLASLNDTGSLTTKFVSQKG